MSHNPKVLHCPLNNANNAWVLSRAERQLGLSSDLVVFQKHPFYPKNFDHLLKIELSTVPTEIKRIKFLFEALKQYDVFHFHFGLSIWDHFFPGLNLLDLSIIKKHHKKIIFTFQGDDVRQKDVFVKNFGQGHYRNIELSLWDRFSDINKRLRIKKIARYADAIFALNPDLMLSLPNQTCFLAYSNIDPHKLRPLKRNHPRKKIKIVHAPSDRLTKGTEILLSTFKKLKPKYPIELLLVENVPHQKAIEIYQQADIAVDQLTIPWYGGFSVEMMALGIPVISYLGNGELIKRFVPYWSEIPIVNANKNNLKDVLENLIVSSSLRSEIGKKSRNFVVEYHDPLKIAKQMIDIYSN